MVEDEDAQSHDQRDRDNPVAAHDVLARRRGKSAPSLNGIPLASSVTQIPTLWGKIGFKTAIATNAMPTA